MGWELFKRQGRFHASSEPGLTIGRKGSALINAVATERYFGGKPFVELYHDKEGGRIALKPVAQAGPGAYAVRRPKGTKHTLVNMSAFFKWNGIPLEKAVRYALRLEGDMLVLEPIAPTKRR